MKAAKKKQTEPKFYPVHPKLYPVIRAFHRDWFKDCKCEFCRDSKK